MIYTLTHPISPGVSPGVSPVVSPGVSPVSTVSPMSLTPGIMHLIKYGDKDLGLLLSQR